MEVVMVQDWGFWIQVWGFACLLVIQGSAVPSVEEGKPLYVPKVNVVLIGEAPTPASLPIGIGLQPPSAVPFLESAPAPQTTDLPSFPSPASPDSPGPSTATPNPLLSPPVSSPDPALFTPPIPPSRNPPSTTTPTPLVSPPTSTPDPANPPSTPTPNPLVPPPASTPDPPNPPSIPTPNPLVPPPASTPGPTNSPSIPTLNPLVPPPASTPDPTSPPLVPIPNPLTPPPASTPDPANSPSTPIPNPLVPPPASTTDPASPPSTPTPPSKPTPNPFVPPPSSSPDPTPLTPPIPPSANPPSTPALNPLVPPPSSANPVPQTPPIPPSNTTPPPQSSPDPVPFTPPIAPAPVVSPSSSRPPGKQPHPAPPTSDKPIAPVTHDPPPAVAPASNTPPAPRGIPESPPPSYSNLPKQPPTHPPDVSPRPKIPGKPPRSEPVPHEPPSSPPVRNASRLLAPPPRIGKRTAAAPVVAPTDRIAPIQAPLSRFPAEAPTAGNNQRHSNNAPPPLHLSKSRSPTPHRSKVFNASSAPPPDVVPPPSSGSSMSSSAHAPVHNSHSPIPAPSKQPKTPSVQPKIAPSQRIPKTPLLPPMQALPPPPPNTDCAPLTCTEPLAYGPPEAPCVCVLPIQVGLRLSVALYTFFPLVSELATEVAAGVFMKQSQVRVMGANAAGDDTEKTVVLIDLLPLGEKFDDTTAYLTFGRFWRKQIAIKTSIFGDYDVLYVRYPGLPPSPPLPPSTAGIIPSKPYPGHGGNGRTIQPLGVDVSRNHHKRGISKSILAMIILSCFVALILVSAVAWVFLIRDRKSAFLPDPTPPTTARSLAKSSGIAGSKTGSGTMSPTSFSLGSSMAAYTGSAKTYSSSEIDKATDFFNEANVLGEGGFGRVYGGTLDDGAKVAIKILKRYDQQGGREFLAEVEMLSRLHHRNLVKLIGICVEDRTRCLVYELVPNGSVESHLHGIDKERSPLDWGARLKIALGAARALAYLHEDSSPRVIHRDFKASNILLEDDFTPKVSDFGLARSALDEDNKHISTRVMGTFGYVAPEYAMTGHLLVKSDVYSYGVVLLELLTGKKPVDMSQLPGQENLVAWARPLLTSREGLESMIDQSVAPDVPFDSIAKVAAIASMCVQPEVSHRPFMGEVVQALKLICSECDAAREPPSRSCSQEDLSMVLEASRHSTGSSALPAPLLSPHSTVSDYDYLLDMERDLSMSELLSSSANLGRGEDRSESFRRHSSSGPLRTTSKTGPLWRTMRRMSRGSVSEHGSVFKLWHGSQ